jgi:pimeloyl-ACP methyl ester carboxylesterase
MTPQPVEVVAANGCVLRGQIWPGESVWVVLLHDVGPDEDLDRWRPLIPSLLAERLSVLAVDLRGHGASGGEWAEEAAVEDVAEIVRYLKERVAETVVVIAAGMTATSALWAAELVRMEGAVLLSPTIVRIDQGNARDADDTTCRGARQCALPNDNDASHPPPKDAA